MLDFTGWVSFLVGIGVMFSGLFLLAPSDREMEQDDYERGGGSKRDPASNLAARAPPGCPVLPSPDISTRTPNTSGEGRCGIAESISCEPAGSSGPGGMMAVEYAVPYTPHEQREILNLQREILKPSPHKPSPTLRKSPQPKLGAEELALSPQVEAVELAVDASLLEERDSGPKPPLNGVTPLPAAATAEADGGGGEGAGQVLHVTAVPLPLARTPGRVGGSLVGGRLHPGRTGQAGPPAR